MITATVRRLVAAVRRRGGDDRGTETPEMLFMAAALVLLMLLVIGMGRYARAGQLVQQAAGDATRAASLAASPDQARTDAAAALDMSLAGAGVSCIAKSVDVDTSDFRAGGVVRVSVSCTANLGDLTVTGLPGTKTVTADAAAPLETRRHIGSGAQP